MCDCSNCNLKITSDCSIRIDNNVPFYENTITIKNICDFTIDEINFVNGIFFSNQLIPSQGFPIRPNTLQVSFPSNSEIRISGLLGPLAPKASIQVSYTIPFSVSQPGEYSIANVGIASSSECTVTTNCSTNFGAFQLSGDKCCKIDHNTGEISFDISVSNINNSPDVSVTLSDFLMIPSGLTIRFTNFGGCSVIFPDGTPVPLNTNINGLQNLNITCTPILVTSGSTFTATIKLKIVGSDLLGTTLLANNLFDIIPIDTVQPLVNLGINNIPSTANVEVTLNAECSSPCNN